MAAVIAIVLQFMPYLVEAAASFPKIITFIAGLQAIFARTKVWTAEQEAEFDAQTEALRSDPAWQITD